MESRSSNINQKQSKSKTNSTKITKSPIKDFDCGDVSESTSHTQFFRKKKKFDPYTRVTRDEYFKEASDGSSSDSFGCVHGPEGKLYTESEQLKRELRHNLDPVPVEQAWTESCSSGHGWEIVKELVFLITDGAPLIQLDRTRALLSDLATISKDGYRVDVLDNIIVILDFLETKYIKEPSLREHFVALLKNINQPILLNKAGDFARYFDTVTNYIGFVGCLLLGLEEDELFAIVSEAMVWQLSAPDRRRPAHALSRRTTLRAAAPALFHAAARILAVVPPQRFYTFLQIALLLAAASQENCIELLKENILENMFYRFNPYFPERKLPAYDINPADPQHYSVRLGASSVYLDTTLTCLLLLVKALKQCCDKDPKFHKQVPAPDNYSQSCFIWAYRYECRARDHQAKRITLTALICTLTRCFGKRLEAFATQLMPDVMSLSVATEVPPRSGWVTTVNFNTSQPDVLFKKTLIYLSVEFIKCFEFNGFMIESQHWFVGLMYLVDPGLMQLRPKWPQPLYDELRQTALQALVCIIPLAEYNVAIDCEVIKRIMWYVEWYSWNPFELSVLYWCLRLLLTAVGRRRSRPRPFAVKDLFESHGIIILMHLCSTLLRQSARNPPVEMTQVILALILRVLASGIEDGTNLKCQVYPKLSWPSSINSLAGSMMGVIMVALERNFIINDRWLISLLNFIWEGIIWRDDYRKQFLAHNGVYQLLDLITMVRAPVQCLALALVCDITSAGDAVPQLVSWRAGIGASNSHLRVVKTGATIASLLASVIRDECRKLGVKLNEYGVIQDLDNPLRPAVVRKALENPIMNTVVYNRNPVCYAAADLAGSRMSKAYALLQMLSEDLSDRVSIADEAYNLYKNIQLALEDEVILVLCSYFLTEKLMETWTETQMQSPTLEHQDSALLEEFLHINKGWNAEIKHHQEEIVEMDRKKKHAEERSLYDFLARVRLTMALDALREVRVSARASSRFQLLRAMLGDAVAAHHRRSLQAANLNEPVLRTYKAPLDNQNTTSQYVQTHCIPKTQKDSEIGCQSPTAMSNEC